MMARAKYAKLLEHLIKMIVIGSFCLALRAYVLCIVMPSALLSSRVLLVFGICRGILAILDFKSRVCLIRLL